MLYKAKFLDDAVKSESERVKASSLVASICLSQFRRMEDFLDCKVISMTFVYSAYDKLCRLRQISPIPGLAATDVFRILPSCSLLTSASKHSK